MLANKNTTVGENYVMRRPRRSVAPLTLTQLPDPEYKNKTTSATRKKRKKKKKK